MTAVQAELHARLSDILVRRIEPLFRDQAKLTLVVRFPGEPTKTVIVSSDHIPTVVAEVVVNETAPIEVSA